MNWVLFVVLATSTVDRQSDKCNAGADGHGAAL